MVEEPDIDDPNAALARLVAENVLATNRATHATRVIASGIYYTTLAALVALVPAAIGALMLAQNPQNAIIFLAVAALAVIIIGIRSIVVMFKDYRASTMPDRDLQALELMNLVSDAGFTREELTNMNQAEAEDPRNREVD